MNRILSVRLFTAILATLIGWGCSTDQSPATLESTPLSIQQEIDATMNPELDASIRETGQPSSASLWYDITGPTTITSPGFYRVRNDFDASADGIVIESDNVWLNLNGYTITGPGNKSGRGIVVNDASGVVVRNGVVRNFGLGVNLNGTSYSVVRNVAVYGGDEFADPPNGVAPQIGIMLVNSSHNWLARNSFSLVNLGIFVRGAGSYENAIFNNVAIGGDNGLLGICYNPAMNEGPAGPQRDQVRHNFLARFGTGIQTSAESVENYFVRNTIQYFNSPYEDLNGSNIFQDNRTLQVTL